MIICWKEGQGLDEVTIHFAKALADGGYAPACGTRTNLKKLCALEQVDGAPLVTCERCIKYRGVHAQ